MYNKSVQEKEERISGIVSESLPQTQFRVQLKGGESIGNIVICYLSGKMFKNHIKVMPGDAVDVVLSPTGDRGRIVRRR